jgi:hypothetical protein
MLSSSTNSCGGVLTSLGCQAANVAGGELTLTTLTVGNTYYVRVYVTSNPTASSTSNWNFNICLQQPPVNDLCTGAVNLTPGATCNSISGTLDLAIPTVVTIATGCVVTGTYYDVWYSFVATAVTHTITLGSLGSNFTAPRIQIFSGTCAALVPVGCASATTLTQGALLIGTTYYVRIANFGANPSGTGTVANFNICLTAAAAAPSNDLCADAVLLTSSTTCLSISGTIHNATASSPVVPGSCGLSTAPDVWYSFIAQTAYPQIQLTGIGTNLQTNGRIQLLTGSCGSFVTVGSCHSIPGSATTTINTTTNPGGAGLTVGQTYYIRITHNTLSSITTNGTFSICIQDPAATGSAILDYSKSYVNLSDTATGGTIDPGDILEIRATLVVRPNGGGVRAIDSVAYYDTLKAGGGLHY